MGRSETGDWWWYQDGFVVSDDWSEAIACIMYEWVFVPLEFWRGRGASLWALYNRFGRLNSLHG